MILVNGIDFLLLRSPEIFIFVYNYYYNHIKIDGLNMFSFNPQVILCTYSPLYLCDTLTDILEIFFVLSLFSQVLIFYYFNSNIKDGLLSLLKIKKK